jgi:RimJ/RimL family protein N-acetyltransferase
MSFYQGQSYYHHSISLASPQVELILNTQIADDVAGAVQHYLASAPATEQEIYFCIYEELTPVGQIVLHDINWESGESLIGYCLFRPELRGRGIGSIALRLLQRFVVEQTRLTRLVIITGVENHASQAIAHKCGFEYVGGAWEDPESLLVFEWRR